MTSRLILRADANERIGHGHVARLMALADILTGFERCFLSINPPPPVAERIRSVADELIALPRPDNPLDEARYVANAVLRAGDIVVLDGYEFSGEYQQIIRSADVKVVYLDDLQQIYHFADVVINPAGGLHVQDYSGEIYTQYRLGPRYAPLRAPFREASQRPRDPVTQVNSAFICFGGSDANNLTERIVKACLSIDIFEQLHVVVGSSYQHHKSLQQLGQAYLHQLHVHQNVSADTMVQLMQRCELAIAPASTIAYELGSVGIGLLTGTSADNQQGIVRFLTESGCAQSVGDFHHCSSEYLQQRIAAASDISRINQQIDCQQRTFADNSTVLRRVFQHLTMETQLNVRSARPNDLLTYFQWANEPEARWQAIHTEPITLDTHTRWFHRKIEGGTDFLFIFERDQQAVGQVRFEWDGTHYTISFSVDREVRGQGLGTLLIKMGLETLQHSLGSRPVVRAYVRPTNLVSRRVFEGNGFVEREAVTIDQVTVVLFEK